MFVASYLANRYCRTVLCLIIVVWLSRSGEFRLSAAQFRQSAPAAPAEQATLPSQLQDFELTKRAIGSEAELTARYRSAQQQACQLPRHQAAWRALGPSQAASPALCAAELAQLNPLENTGNDWALATGVATADAQQWWVGAGANGLWRGSAGGWQNILPGFVGGLAWSAPKADNATLYVARQDWELLKSTDDGQSFLVASLSRAQRQTDDALLLAPLAAQGAELWTGGRCLWHSLDGGASWQRASRALHGADNARFSVIAVAPNNPDLVLAGTNQGELLRLEFARQSDEQTLWPTVQPRAGFVTSIVFDPQVEQRVYATYATFGGPHVWLSENGGVSWRALDGAGATALPDVPINALAIDPADQQRLYAGSDLGVFVTFDSGENWQLLTANFGAASVRALTIRQTEAGNQLYVFTARQGLWLAQLPAVATQQQPACVQTLTPTGSVIESGGGRGSFNVTAPADCRWLVSNLPSWVQITEGEVGTGNGRVAFTVEPNPDGGARTAQLSVGGRRFALSQIGANDSCAALPLSSGQLARGELAQGDCLSSVYPGLLHYADRYTFAARRGELLAIWASKTQLQQIGGLGPLRLLSPTGRVIQDISSYNTELRLPGYQGALLELTETGNYIFELTTAYPQQLVAYQVSLHLLPPGCNRYDLMPLDRYFDAGRTTGRVAVSTLAGCRWQAVSTVPWLTFNHNTGSGNALLEFNVANNANGGVRSGYIEIAGQRFSLTQAGGSGNCVPVWLEVGKTVSGEFNANDCPVRFGDPHALNYAPADRYQFSGRARQRIKVVVSSAGQTLSFTHFALANARGDLIYLSQSRQPASTEFVELPNDDNYFIEVGAAVGARPIPYTLSLLERNEGCSYGLAPVQRVFEASGGTGEFQLNTSPNCSWSVLPTPDWITVTSSQSGEGNATIKLAVTANLNSTARSATLNIAGQNCLVIQAGAQSTCGPQAITAGRNISAQFTAGDCPPQLYPLAEPLTPPHCGACSAALPVADRYSFSARAGEQFSLLVNASGYGPMALGYTLADAQGNLLKSGTLAAGQFTPPFNLPGAGEYLLELLPLGTSLYPYTFVVSLAPTGCETAAQVSLTRFAAAGGAGTLTVAADNGCLWRATATTDSNVPWLALNGSGEGSGNGMIEFSVARNPSTFTRVGKLRLGAQSFVIEQAGHGGNCQPVEITPGQVISGALMNNDCSALYRNVTEPTNTVNTDRYNFSATAGQQVTLTNVPLIDEVTGRRLARVLTLVDPQGQVLNNSHTNRLPDGAYLLTLTGQYTVEVAALIEPAGALGGPYQFLLELTTPGCVYFVNPGPLRFPNTARMHTVEVITSAGCSWTPRPTANWLSVNPPTGTGSGTLSVNLTSNQLGPSRRASLLIAGQRIEFEQAGGGGDCAVKPLLPGTPVTGTLTVGDCLFQPSPRNTVADRYSFTAQAGDQVRFSANFSVNGSPYPYPPSLYLYDALGNSVTGLNTRALAPDTYIRLATAGTYFLEVVAAPSTFPYTLELTRLPGTCEVRVAETQLNFDGAGGTGALTVRAGSGCAWTARSDAPWLTLTSDAQGTGDGTVRFAVAALTSGVRNGSLVVEERRVNIHQQVAQTSRACVPQAITLGQARGGALTTADCFAVYYQAGISSYADHFVFEANAGQQVAVELTNRQFEGFLTLYDQQGRALRHGSNRAPSGANEFHPLAASGRYFIEVVSTSNNPTGNYTLKLATPTACNSVLSFANSTQPFANQLFGVAGGAGTVNVATGADCVWTAQSSAAWLRTTGSGNGPGSFTFTVLPNPTNSHRAARLSINNGSGEVGLIVEQSGSGGDCSARTLTPGERVTGTLVPGDCRLGVSWPLPEQTLIVDRFQFAAQAGDQLVLVQELLEPGSGYLQQGLFTLYDPHGRVVGEPGQGHIPGQQYNTLALPTGTLMLPKTGTYTLEYASLRSLDYTFRFGLSAGGCGFVLPAEQPQFTSTGGVGSLALQTTGNCAWTAHTQADWITITNPSGAGNGTISFTVAPNPGAYRFGAILIAGRSVTVFQTGAGGSCTPVPVTPGQLLNNELNNRDCRRVPNDGSNQPQFVDRYSFSARAGERAFVKVTADQVIAAAVLPQATLNAAQLIPASDWLGNAAFTIPADGSYIIEVFASYNTALPAPYTLRLQVLPPGCGVALNPALATFDSTGGTGSVAITAAANCQSQILSSHDWLTFNGEATRTGNATLQFNVAPNQSDRARTGTIGIGGQPFTVEQAGANGACIAQALTSGQSVTGQLNQADCPARVPLLANYRDFADRYTFDGAAGQMVQLLVQALTQTTSQFSLDEPGLSGALCPTCGSTQTAPQISLYDPNGNLLARNEYNALRLPSTGDFLRLPLTGAYTIELATRFSVTTGPGSTFDYALLFTQLPRTCSYTVTPGALAFAATGGNDTLTVATAAACTWHAVVDAPWISFDAGSATRTGNGQISFTVAANPAETLRHATINVAGQSFTIEQAGSNGLCQTQPLSAGQTIAGKFNLGDCRVPRDRDPSGNLLVRRFSFSGAAGEQVALSAQAIINSFTLRLLAPNGNLLLSTTGLRLPPQNELYVLPMSGTYSVELYGYADAAYALTLFVVQNGCGYALSASGQRFAASGGTGSVNVTASGNCAWQARSNAAWISLQGGGAGSSTLSYTVAANHEASARTGTIILANRVFVIEQAGSGGSCEPRVLQPGQTVNGVWNDGDCRSRTHASVYAHYVDRYSFTASAGDSVSFSLTTAADTVFIELYDPAGNLLATSRSKRFPATVGRFVLPSSGSFGLHLVSPYNGTSYTLGFLLNSPGTINGGAAVHVNAANFKTGGLAPDSLVTVFGLNLANVTQTASTPVANLGGTTVQVRDSAGATHLAQLLFVSPTQISYVMPGGLAYGAATITTTNNDGAETNATVELAPVAPGLFAADASGRGMAAGLVLRVKADRTQVFEPLARFDPLQHRFVAVPIDLSAPDETVYLILFGTGYRWRSGLAAVRVQLLAGSETINVPLSASYAGEQGSLSGLDQLNLALPRSLSGAGACEVNVMVDSKAANSLRIQIR